MDLRFDHYKDANGKAQVLDHAYVINALLAMPKAYDAVVATLYIRDHYESYYRINSHQHGARKDLMPMIAYTDAEDTFETSYLRERMARFRKSGVLEMFGVPWDRFILLPKTECDALIDESEIAIKEKEVDTLALQAEMNSLMPKTTS